ncbi:MAG TPA: bifunctional phosphoribosylaminoimidazolecarboxamide formyltransferase/IMP cyclohydrolase [Steroidobacteraceae bacterium]|nr:bifunctional phosphoribosylaminoimidazolecarboxamide formyltransferase/IMP cyclohydrolase [Steroidobacteraceae bacterium]
MLQPVRRALLSVSDKNGVLELAHALAARGIEILSTGGTARLLRTAGLRVREVADYTGFPEIMDGRVKTLHPKIHGGLLGRRGRDDAVMAEHQIEPIDLLIVNLYPFARAVSKLQCSYEDGIENIDIGGPAMVRAAAKNHEFVTVVVEPGDYPRLLAELATHQGHTSFELRAALAATAYAHTAQYDTMVSQWLMTQRQIKPATFPPTLPLVFEKLQDLRYGENPHQQAAFYRPAGALSGGLAAARVLQGKELSFNNIADADTAIGCVRQFSAPACVIVKHANPCGVCQSVNLLAAYEGAHRTDPVSAFGGIIAFNREVDAATARSIVGRQFAEVILAPAFNAEACAVLAEKPNIRVLELPWAAHVPAADDGAVELRSVAGGLLVQTADTAALPDSLNVVTRRAPTEAQMLDLRFAWRVCQFVKSNAIVFARAGATIGIGAGQMSRVYSTRIAALKATDEKLEVAGAAMASDAYFPFRDGLEAAASLGIQAVIQPGGSRRDDEVIAAADEYDIAMVFTGVRHFRH